MDQDARSAKAEAKVATAKAKALRPWYLKKRTWFAGAVVVLIVAAVASSGGGDSSTDTADGSEIENTETTDVRDGLGSQDASSDLTVLDCGSPDELGYTYPKVTVTNNSSERSNYIITIVAESADGATKYDDTIVMITDLEPGQSMTENGGFLNEIPPGSSCRVTEVQRLAS